MAAQPSDPLEKWRNDLRENVQLLKIASCSGDEYKVASFEEKFSEAVATQNGFHPAQTDNTSQLLSKLKGIVDTGIDETQETGSNIATKIDKFKETPQGKSVDKAVWQDMLRQNVDKVKGDSAKMFDDLLKNAEEKIKQLPPAAREGATNIVSAAVSKVSIFVCRIVAQVEDFFNRTWDFLRNIVDKVNLFIKNIGGWASAALDGVKSIFRGLSDPWEARSPFTGGSDVVANRVDGFNSRNTVQLSDMEVLMIQTLRQATDFANSRTRAT